MENERDNSELIIGYLEGKLDSQKIERFYTFVNQSEANKQFYFEMKAIYEACAPMKDPAFIHKSWLRLLQKRQASGEAKSRFWIQVGRYAAVAAVAVAVTSGVFFYLFSHHFAQPTYYIGGDGLEADLVVLPDGTHVSLGSKTTFHYDADYGKSQRIVHLEGEAYFEVAPRKNKPFIVRTSSQDIQALGTKFNVTAYPHDSLIITTLLQGAVRLTAFATEGSIQLKPNEQLVYNRITHKTTLGQVDASRFTAWTSGYYYFPEQSLEAILYRLSHVYGVTFVVNSEELKHRTFTGTFYRGQSIKDIMEIIHLSIPIRYSIQDRCVTLSEI